VSMRYSRFVLVLVLVGLLAGCCLSPHADQVMAIDRAISANKGHMADEGLPAEAREIAQDNHDVFWQVRIGLTDDKELPADVRARADDRAGPDGGGDE